MISINLNLNHKRNKHHINRAEEQEVNQKEDLKKFCELKEISNNIEFKGQVDNVYEYMKNAEIFVLTSLWEDPGFVIIEAGYNNLFVISSDCPHGPREFLNYGDSGILFKSVFKFMYSFQNFRLNVKL